MSKMSPIVVEEFRPVPLVPPAKVGVFLNDIWWAQALFGISRLNSALRYEAVEQQRLGPRGGWRYAATDRYLDWAADFNQRAYRRWIGVRSAATERRLAKEFG